MCFLVDKSELCTGKNNEVNRGVKQLLAFDEQSIQKAQLLDLAEFFFQKKTYQASEEYRAYKGGGFKQRNRLECISLNGV